MVIIQLRLIKLLAILNKNYSKYTDVSSSPISQGDTFLPLLSPRDIEKGIL